MQMRVREKFRELQKMDEGRIPWKVVNAAQSIEEVEAEIWGIVTETMESIKQGDKPVSQMWQDGYCDLSRPDDKEN